MSGFDRFSFKSMNDPLALLSGVYNSRVEKVIRIVNNGASTVLSHNVVGSSLYLPFAIACLIC
jgi:hypothetical protein